ncbi:DNA-binding NtrC family response regulator [Pontibacter ummariensis]|uniref:DNA-binding transcriptional response regulator, NtrC family, contains REC, AAA-type ATPase, and a Fis-type DNA-binding domains n=1 Tax=Pontibacter ummariensis TaxID=1610492 RepID=A0A239GHC4_9BACT|nr:sigma-54 dependent transcriptional regulator [Pontibacter ummariensis]PRY11252.1 DNA-binding NtrC family response regulator [Pontibacter ummariensis]SNS68162.1 DNA-binding transcriptional response regulator, NtrC family, contains REC, AAA-type ATPase, and a Fis-type DNA-binding domains [Pontibacter ummariensis]
MILIIDDDIAIRASLSLLLKQQGYKTKEAASPKEALEQAKLHPLQLVIMDMNFSIETTGEDGLHLLGQFKQLMPQVPVILITGWGSIHLAVEGMRAGAADFITKPWSNEYLLQSVRTALSLSQEPAESGDALTRKKLDKQYDLGFIVGQDQALLQILKKVGQIAPTDASVLIEGESGTGKELIAEAVHRNSLRKNHPFVKVNLGGISSSLFESEMFGHKRGAFTDAKLDRTGRFEIANKGTIFLDEIGELDLSSQIKLLRVLQDRTYEVLGDSRSRKLDIRVVCATNKDLAQLVEEGKFREDLYYRINLIKVKLPPLREREEDIPLLVRFFVENLKKTYHRPALQVSARALQWLKELPLPGNIRELKNLVERTVLVAEDEVLEAEDFQAQAQQAPAKPGDKTLPAVGTMTLDEMEASMIRKSMTFYHNNISKVAKALGLSRAALYRRLDKFNIPYEAAD